MSLVAFCLAMMYNSRQYVNIAVFAFVFFLKLGLSSEDGELNQLPYCGVSTNSANRRLVFVSTLDGEISALNIDEGTKAWSVRTGPGPLLSSSIHTLELTSNGQLVRMIPSLNGGLYKFDGDHIQPIPITAEKLLQSSFRYSDDIVISGGKESRTYGVDSSTGEVLYECTMDKCDNLTSREVTGDVVLIQRQSQTVRAVEPRTGLERWNFSVGEHDVKLVGDPAADCHNKEGGAVGVVLKVVVPDGLVCAVTTSSPPTLLWQHKFEVPVVSAWRADEGRLQWVDLFGGAPTTQSNELPRSPLLYVGMYNKQVYIQESVLMQRKLLDSGVGRSGAAVGSLLPAIPWKPVPASILLGISGVADPVLQITDESQAHLTTALSVLYATEFVNGNGFFLYGEEEEAGNGSMCEERKQIGYVEEKEKEREIEEQSLHLSLWFYWKEILLISVTTGVVVNLFNRRRYLWGGLVKAESIEKPMEEPPPYVESLPSPPFTSRYLTDFQPVHCLGRGGFGVVFQASNKIDDCHYAVKRIPLPNKDEARERVMREVKALAKLNHQHIVRYFNAWLESPPSDWLHHQDQLWPDTRSDAWTGGGGVSVELKGLVTPGTPETPEPGDPREASDLHSKSGPLRWWRTLSFSKRSHAESSSDSDDEAEDEEEEEEEEEGVKEERAGEESDSFIVFGMAEGSGATTATAPAKPSRPTSLHLTSHRSLHQRSGEGVPRVFLYIQMELCRRESLREWLEREVDREPDQVYNIFHQIVLAVEYVHLQGLIHRDLKPSNIFFSLDGEIKVGDFGLVTAMGDGGGEGEGASPHQPHVRHTARVGTHLYMSPEQMEGVEYSYKVDIYSLGVMLYELLVPFSTQMERLCVLTKLRQLHFPDFFMASHPEEYQLLKLMLSPNPDERPTTIGIRNRAPLQQLQPELERTEDWHFSLQGRIRTRDSSFNKS